MPQFQWMDLISGSRTLHGPANVSGSDVVTNVTSTATSDALTKSIYETIGLNSLVLAGTTTVNTPSAAVSASANQVTSSSGLLFTTTAANSFTLGLKVQFTTSSALPTGISASTDYFVVPASSLTYHVATSLANALAGTFVAYTDTGTGNQTATPVAIAAAALILQGSNDQQVTWSTVPNTSTAITATGDIVIEVDYIRYAAYRVSISMTAGQLTFTKLQFAYRGQ